MPFVIGIDYTICKSGSIETFIKMTEKFISCSVGNIMSLYDKNSGCIHVVPLFRWRVRGGGKIFYFHSLDEFFSFTLPKNKISIFNRTDFASKRAAEPFSKFITQK